MIDNILWKKVVCVVINQSNVLRRMYVNDILKIWSTPLETSNIQNSKISCIKTKTPLNIGTQHMITACSARIFVGHLDSESILNLHKDYILWIKPIIGHKNLQNQKQNTICCVATKRITDSSMVLYKLTPNQMSIMCAKLKHFYPVSGKPPLTHDTCI